jgi:aminopeptidase
MDATTLDRYADLIVNFGANVQAGQEVLVNAPVGNEPLARAIAERLYREGAVFVEVRRPDPYIQRARVEHGSDDALGYEPQWVRQMIRDLGDTHGAVIGLSGNPVPGILDGLDPGRVARDVPPGRREHVANLTGARTNWTIAAGPTIGWAVVVHPQLEPEEALATLWQQVIHMCRLDELDPVAAWEARIAQIDRAKAALDGRRFDALHLEGPGTDLTVGLLPSSRWHGGYLTTCEGVLHHPNLPSEEVFTTPDPTRTEGIVRATKPLELAGSIVRDFTVRFEAGRVVDVQGAAGADVLLAHSRRDDGAARLGEVALVDREGRVGPLDTVFLDTLIDENAASHIALGQGFDWAVADADRERINRSEVHIDFMIGSSEVDVTGITASGDRIPVLRSGAWQI